MDRKSILVLAVSGVLLGLYLFFVGKLYPPKPAEFSTNRLNRLETNNQVAPRAGQSTNQALLTSSLPSQASVAPNAGPEELLVAETDEARYIFSSRGGGIKTIELKKYPESVGCGAKRPASPKLAALNEHAPRPAFTLAGPDDEGSYTLRKTATGVVAAKALSNGLHITKEYTLGADYMVKLAARLENQTNQPISVPPQQWVIGTATAIGTNSNPALTGFYCFDGNRAEHINEAYFANRTMGCAMLPSVPKTEYSYLGTSNIVWAAVHNQFFTMLTVPSQPCFGLHAMRVYLDSTNVIAGLTNFNSTTGPHGYEVAMVFPGADLAPQQTLDRQFDLYAGPKEYRSLSKLPHKEVLVMDFGGFIGWFAQVLLFSMNKLHDLGLNYGLTIIVITVIIKTLFWPLTNASTKSMKRMSALQPQMKALQEKYKDDPRKMNTKLMEFMKENKVSPIGGCLPMVLQIPVFFGFYKMLQTAIELRGASFLWACDLSQSDTIFIVPWLGFIPFFSIPGIGLPINPLPLMMGATMLWQAQLTPPSPGVDPVQQKIMKYMPLMFMVFLYNFSAGLTLYWTVQNLLTIAQTKLTRTNARPATTPQTPAPPGRSGPQSRRSR